MEHWYKYGAFYFAATLGGILGVSTYNVVDNTFMYFLILLPLQVLEYYIRESVYNNWEVNKEYDEKKAKLFQKAKDPILEEKCDLFSIENIKEEKKEDLINMKEFIKREKKKEEDKRKNYL